MRTWLGSANIDALDRDPMPTTPTNWSIVVAGAWNLAILTPDGIRKRLFELPERTSINIEVAVDRPGLFRVLHDQLAVSPSARALEITVQQSDLNTLLLAGTIATRAVTSLSETPLTGAGINMRYVMTPITERFDELCKAALDDVLSDANETIVSRVTRRSLALDKGVLNIELMRQSDHEAEVAFNFHCDAPSADDCKAWLARIDEFHKKMMALLVDLTGEAP